MNKFMTLFMVILFLVLSTLVVNSLYDVSGIPDITTGVIGETPDGFLAILTNIGDMVGGFWKIMTFQVPELPVAVNLIVFYPLSIMVFFMVIDLIRG